MSRGLWRAGGDNNNNNNNNNSNISSSNGNPNNEQVDRQNKSGRHDNWRLPVAEELEDSWQGDQQAQSARCNCAGNKRRTLNGLIELFEQKVQVFEEEEEQQQRGEEEKMRDIITPVRYEPNTSNCSSSSASSLADPSMEANGVGVDKQQQQASNKSPLQRIASKGVPVLPVGRHLQRKLQANRWAPATDGRHYEQQQQQRQEQNSNCAQCNRWTRGSLGPNLVRHQPSSSRRLLGQLARLRRLSEPNYRVRRPEKVAQVERLIEELERATADWAEDEQLLDRAERRDLPERYQRLAIGHDDAAADEEEEDYRQEEEAEFGLRTDVHPQEAAAIARAHQRNRRQASNPMSSAGSGRASATSGGGHWRQQQKHQRPTTNTETAAAAAATTTHAHRYHDDLAVRRLGSQSSAASAAGGGGHHLQAHMAATADVGQRPKWPEMSYLLCSSAYTPPMESPTPPPIHERRIRHDDLHFRTVHRRRRPEPSEPPFGIPRNQPPLLASATNLSGGRQQQQQQQSKRSDSRVSFVDSVDSGVTHMLDSPLSPMEGRRSATSRLTTTTTPPSPSGYRDQDEDDVTQEVDLGLELDEEEAEEEADVGVEEPVEGDALERCRAEYRATPTRRRPQIRIENPRAKSPLLPLATTSKTQQQQQQHQQNSSSRSKAHGLRPETPIEIRTYEEKVRKSLEELECEYQFSDDDDYDEDEEKEGAAAGRHIGARRPKSGWRSQSAITTTTSFSESSLNESSIERLNYRGSGKVDKDEHPSMKNQKRPLFSIGQYKPMNKPGGLKIL